MEVKRIFVVGAGLMGAGIAEVAARAGYEVALQDLTEDLVKKGYARIEKDLTKQVEKGKLSAEEMQSTLGRVKLATDLKPAAEADLVIEAIIEDAGAKKELFKKLDEICPPQTILASNTSSIPITELAAAIKRADKFIGMHFFSPVPVMKLVEIIKGLKTSEETAAVIRDVVEKLGKVGVMVKDSPGFLVNRVNAALRSEVYRCLEEGVASIEDIDKALKFGLNHPMGPFELQDNVGLDIGLAVFQTLYDNFKDPKWAPALSLKKLVAAGDLGKKTGKGWYDYTSGEKKVRTDLNL
ncbi:MAG: 3-hydroxybutyryl-CoA dehydrogenase [Firmicutes bacterium]|nr:3-hydroxybutyryl-CoA dehydrogenase [Bacillota bacterium]